MVWLSEGVKSWTTIVNMFNIITSKGWREIKGIPVRFSWSHFEFLGLMWLSHHHEYILLEFAWDKVAIAPEKGQQHFVFWCYRNLTLQSFEEATASQRSPHSFFLCVFTGITNKTKRKQAFSYKQIEAVYLFLLSKMIFNRKKIPDQFELNQPPKLNEQIPPDMPE